MGFSTSYRVLKLLRRVYDHSYLGAAELPGGDAAQACRNQPNFGSTKPPWHSFRLEQHEVSMPARAASCWRPPLAAVPSSRSCAVGLRSAALVAEGSSSEDVGEQG